MIYNVSTLVRCGFVCLVALGCLGLTAKLHAAQEPHLTTFAAAQDRSLESLGVLPPKYRSFPVSTLDYEGLAIVRPTENRRDTLALRILRRPRGACSGGRCG